MLSEETKNLRCRTSSGICLSEASPFCRSAEAPVSYETLRPSTHTFDNHSHRAGVSRLERGSNHGESTPLTLASRCGSVGPLLRPRECTTTPVPPGEYDEARGSRPRDVGVSSLGPHSQRPTKGARRRRTTSRLPTSPPKLTKQLRRADKARSESLPQQTQKQQRRGPWANGQTSHEKTAPAEPWPDRSTSSPRRGDK